MSRSGRTGPPAFETPGLVVARHRRLQAVILAAFVLALLGVDCLGGLLRTRPEPAGEAQSFAVPPSPNAVPGALPDDCSIAPDLAPFYGLAMNINRATERDLTLLPGIGPVLAARITATRGERGGFTDVRQLREVPGVGDKTLAALAPHICVR